MPVPMEDLEGLPLFEGLSSIELEEVAAHCHRDEAEAGVVLIRENDPPHNPIYVLTSGTVEIAKLGADGRDHTISTLAAPSVFGEVEVLARRPAIASVRTTSKVHFASLGRGVFDELCDASRSCVLKMVRNLAGTLSYRLAATDQRLAAYFSQGHPDAETVLPHVRGTLYNG